MGNAVDAKGEAGDYGDGVAAKSCDDHFAGFAAIWCVLSRADHAEELSATNHAARADHTAHTAHAANTTLGISMK